MTGRLTAAGLISGSHATLPLSSENTAPTTFSAPPSTSFASTGFELRICSTVFSTLIRTALSIRVTGSARAFSTAARIRAIRVLKLDRLTG